MEEILASIRRIIENNDPVESLEISNFSNPSPKGGDAIELTIDNDISLLAEVPEPLVAPVSQHGESLVGQVVPEKPEAVAARPMSLADVAARVKAASERRSPAAPANDTDRPSALPQPQSFNDDHREAAEVYPEPANSVVEQMPAEIAVAAAAPYEEPVMNSFEGTSTAQADDVELADQPAMDPIERFATEIGNEIAASLPAQLLSPVTEEKVSRSFEELADALGGSKRSLDEIAEEMLKPMLQEWLDDNLPTMVERLVREEIERVARGPRR
jgi:cell pole-organizing protein PopZ